MESKVAMIGFGEAASAFVGNQAVNLDALRVFDLKTLDPVTAPGKEADYAAARVTGTASLSEALRGATAILSLVNADQALADARPAARAVELRVYFFDMISVAFDTKRASARAIEPAGGRYLDVAVMAPVHPARAAVRLLVSRRHAEGGCKLLCAIGFSNVRIVSEEVGTAPVIKMLRSVIVKGIEALTAECVLAAEKIGVQAEILASLDGRPAPPTLAERADYNLDRMMVHGLRRAAEMGEVVKTLDALDTGASKMRGTVARQQTIGSLSHARPPFGLLAKLAMLSDAKKAEAA